MNEKLLNLKKAISSVLSVLFLIYDFVIFTVSSFVGNPVYRNVEEHVLYIY